MHCKQRVSGEERGPSLLQLRAGYVQQSLLVLVGSVLMHAQFPSGFLLDGNVWRPAMFLLPAL